MEWTVVTVLVVLVGLFFTIGKPVLGIIKELQALRIETNRQEKEISRETDTIKELVKISQSHENRLCNTENGLIGTNESIAELLKVSQSHEIRIHDLEQNIGELKEK